MNIKSDGSYLSTQRFNKKSNGEEFFISKLLLDTDDLVEVYSEEEPMFNRGDIVSIDISINLEKKTIYTSFV